jgi:transcriptional regulator with XRE-family HTH domain
MEKSIFTPEYAILRAELVSIRKAAGLTQREVARRLDVPPSWVAKAELGERRVDFVELVWVLVACGLDPAPSLADLATKLKAIRTRRSRTGGRSK